MSRVFDQTMASALADQHESGEAVLDEASGVAAVGADQGWPVVRVGDLSQQDLDGGAVTGVRGGDHHTQRQAECVDHDMPLAAVDLLAAVVAASSAPTTASAVTAFLKLCVRQSRDWACDIRAS